MTTYEKIEEAVFGSLYDADLRILDIERERKQLTSKMSQNPLRKFMNRKDVGFMELSRMLDRKISPFALQRMSLGFSIPVVREFGVLAKVMNTDPSDLASEWATWVFVEPVVWEGVNAVVQTTVRRTAELSRNYDPEELNSMLNKEG